MSTSQLPRGKKRFVTPVGNRAKANTAKTTLSFTADSAAVHDPYHPDYVSQILLTQSPEKTTKKPESPPHSVKPPLSTKSDASSDSVQILCVKKPPTPALPLRRDDSTVEVLGTTQPSDKNASSCNGSVTILEVRGATNKCGILTPSPKFQRARHKKFQLSQASSQEIQTEDDRSSCVIDWASTSYEIKKEKLQNKIEESRNTRRPKKASNYHRKSKRLLIGDIVTGKVGKLYKKPNGKNNLRKPVLGKVVESIDNNAYKVKFVNNTEHVLKSSQLIKQKDDIMYNKLTEKADDSSSEATFKHIDNIFHVNNDTHDIDNCTNVDNDDGDTANDNKKLSNSQVPSSHDEQEEEQCIHKKRYKDAVASINAENGRRIKVKSKNEEMVWTIVGDSYVLQKQQQRTNNKLGIKDLSVIKEIEESPLPLADLFLKLSFVDGEWERALVNMNRKIEEHNTMIERSSNHTNDSTSTTKGLVKVFGKKEFLCCIALIVGAADCSDKGEVLWSTSKPKGKVDEQKHWRTICEKTDFRKYIPLYRFKNFRTFFPKLWEEDQNSATDPWWRFSSAVRDFNAIRKDLILPSEIIAVDESMSAFRPQTTSTGRFPNISFIARKPENLGTEFKSSVCPVLGVMMFLELQRGKNGMTNHKYFKDLGATASCTVRIAEGTSHKNVDNVQEVVLGDSWFGSVKAAVGLAQEGFEAILQVKQNHGLYPKNVITDILKDAPGGAKVVLSGTHPSGVELVATGYKYNKKSVLYFVSTPNAGSTEDGEDPYEMKFSDENGNIHIREVPRPALVSFFFQHCNAVDVHNHLRQSSLRLEKKWVTFDGYFRLATTLLGMNVVDTYRLARFHSFLPRGKFKLDKEYEKDFEEDDENGFTMKRFAGVLSTQLLFMADSFKVETFYVDKDGKLKSRIDSHGKSDIVKDVAEDVVVDESDIGDSVGTRLKRVDVRRFRVSEQMRKNKRKNKGVGSNLKRPAKKPKKMKLIDDSHDSSRRGEQELTIMVPKTVMFWADEENDNKARGNGSISSVSCSFTEDESNRIIETYQDVNGDVHTVMKLKSTVSSGEKTKGKTYCKPRQCVSCGTKTRTFCYECKEVHCYPIRKNILVEDSCFISHLNCHKVRRGKKCRRVIKREEI